MQRSVPVRLPVSAKDLALPGDLTTSGAGKGLVIFVHGSGSSRMSPRNRSVAAVLAQAGLATLLFDLLTEAEATDRANVFDIPLLAARVFATGLRNPNGLTFHPETGVLWAVINERDELGPNLVPDYLTSVVENGFYGWPYSYYGPHVDERVRPKRPDLVAAAIKPDYALSSHVAALGLVFTHGAALPEDYADGAFVGQRGSWNRDEFNGYKVSFLPFRDGMPDGMLQDVVTGFLLPEEEKVRGRPVGLGLDGTGALLIADDAGNTVWRVAAADGRVSEAPVETDRVAGPASAAAGQGSAAGEAAPGGEEAPAEPAIPGEAIDEPPEAD